MQKDADEVAKAIDQMMVTLQMDTPLEAVSYCLERITEIEHGEVWLDVELRSLQAHERVHALANMIANIAPYTAAEREIMEACLMAAAACIESHVRTAMVANDQDDDDVELFEGKLLKYAAQQAAALIKETMRQVDSPFDVKTRETLAVALLDEDMAATLCVVADRARVLCKIGTDNPQ